MMNCSNIPVEVHEANNPIRVQQMSFIPDSGLGAGKHRGGCGQRKDIELLNKFGDVAAYWATRHKYAPYGLFGGEDGKLAGDRFEPASQCRTAWIERNPAAEKRRCGQYPLVRCRRIYGDPSERDSAAIAADLAGGYITER